MSQTSPALLEACKLIEGNIEKAVAITGLPTEQLPYCTVSCTLLYDIVSTLLGSNNKTIN